MDQHEFADLLDEDEVLFELPSTYDGTVPA
jgi:hypothetical protein